MFQVLHGSLRSAFEVAAQQNDLEIILKTIWHFTIRAPDSRAPLASRPKHSMPGGCFFLASYSRAILKCLNVLADREVEGLRFSKATETVLELQISTWLFASACSSLLSLLDS